MNLDQEAIGLTIRALRKARNLRLPDMYSHTGVHVSRWSRIENGKLALEFYEAVQLCELFGIKLMEFQSLCEQSYKLQLAVKQ